MNYPIARRNSAVTIFGLFLFIGYFPANAQVYQKTNIELKLSGGYTISADYYSLEGKRGPAVLLIPMFGHDKSEWEPYLPWLKKAKIVSILVLNNDTMEISWANHDKNIDELSEKKTWRSADDTRVLPIEETLETAWRFLKSSPSTDSTRMGIIGASIGANYSAIFAAKDPDVKSLVMLSPGVIYRGVECIDAVREYGKRALFMAASSDDPYSANSCRELEKESAGTPVHIEIYDGSARGTALLDSNDKFGHFLSDWFLSTL